MITTRPTQRAPRSHRATFWLTGLITAELAIAGAILVYRSIIAEDPRNIAPMWAAIFALTVMGIHTTFWTALRALQSQPIRPIRAWLAFAAMMICCGLTALMGALAVVTLRYPIT